MLDLTKLHSSLPLVLFVLAPAAAAQDTGVSVREWFAQPWERLPDAGFFAYSPAVGDLDGDGTVDLVVGITVIGFGDPPIPAGLGLWRGRAGATFVDASTRVEHTNVPSGPPAVFDADGDGDLDVVAAGTPNEQLVVVLNEGSARLVPGPTLGAADTNDRVAVGDVDMDGDLDVLAFRNGGSDVDGMYWGNGLGGFQDASALFPSDSGGSTGGGIGDVDLDGDNEIVVAKATGANELYLRSGFSWTESVGAFSSGGGTDVVIADLDGDSQPDVLTATSLHLGQGGGSFVDASSNLPTATGELDFDLVDADQDGIDDLLAANFFFRGTGGANYVDATSALPEPGGRGASGDFDGDLDVDLVSIRPGAATGFSPPVLAEPFLTLGDGAGGFAEVDQRRERFPQREDLLQLGRLGDMDGDGDDDVVAIARPVTLNESEQRLTLQQNGGLGSFEDRADLFAGQQGGASDLALADVDGDGDLDVLAATRDVDNGPNGGTMVWLNAFPAPFSGTTYGFGDHEAVAVGDLDADGDLDVVTAVSGPGMPPDLLLRGDGTGAFTVETFGQAGPSDTVALFDYLRDGDLDIVVSGVLGTQLFRNDGAAGFVEVTGVLPASRAQALSSSDLDGDGDLDLLAGGVNAWFWRNDGAAGVTVIDPGVALPDAFQAVRSADVDGDGDRDVLLLGANAAALVWNRGGGSFASARGTGVPNGVRVPADFGDPDLDGDPDLLAGGQLYVNTARHLSLRDPLSLGEDVELRLWGDPNRPWVLAASLGTVRVGVGSLGFLRLDPATLELIGSGSLDMNGKAWPGFTLPNDTALLGQPAYFQALIGTPQRLTNVDFDLLGAV